MQVGGVEFHVIDFSETLISGDSIASAAWAISVESGVDGAGDPTPSPHLMGPWRDTSTITTQIIGGLVLGVTYGIKVTVHTTMGETIVRSSPLTCVGFN